jgi:hypothetical protein
MKCPNCKLENPPDAMRCDCGYDFTSADRRTAATDVARRRRRAPVVAAPLPVLATARPSIIRQDTRVVIADINMRFGSMVLFMVKWAFAAIPAIIIIFGIVFITLSVLFGLLGGSAALFQHR